MMLKHSASDGESPIVSVIIPAFNAELTIEYAIKSALTQTVKNIEILIYDDASTDSTVSLVNEIQDIRLRVFSGKSNLGPGPARDIAITHAGGQWVAMLDADDAWEPNRLELMLEAGERFRAELVFDNTMLCHDVGGRIVPWRPLRKVGEFGISKDSHSILINVREYIQAKRLLIHPLIRRQFIECHCLHHSDKRFAEDAEFYLSVAHAGGRFAYVPYPLYLYRIAPGSLTAVSKDPTLMRRCIEECSSWAGWSNFEIQAFQEKIKDLKYNESLYLFSKLLSNMSLISAAKILLINPSIVLLLLVKSFDKLHYHVHRIIVGGAKR